MNRNMLANLSQSATPFNYTSATVMLLFEFRGSSNLVWVVSPGY